MRLKNAKPRTHSLPKIHKTFTNIPKIKLIIDTTGSDHYLVGLHLAQLLYPLANNKFQLTLKEFNLTQLVAFKIFHPVCLWMGINMCLLMLESLFTNAPIKETIDVILTQIYNDHTISTNLKKWSLKKSF